MSRRPRFRNLLPLPPVESLTFDSDFAAFMQPKVDEATKRAALKKLFSDPSFNVMDGLDIYVGDYTQADPMPEGMLERLSAVYKMLDPVETPPEETEAAGDIAPLAGAVPIAETAPCAEVPLVAEAEIPIEATAIDDATVPMTADSSVSGETGADDADAAKPA